MRSQTPASQELTLDQHIIDVLTADDLTPDERQAANDNGRQKKILAKRIGMLSQLMALAEKTGRSSEIPELIKIVEGINEQLKSI